MPSLLLRYSELALKGRNRPWFQRHLVQHLRRALAGLGVRELRTPMGRLELVLAPDAPIDTLRERLTCVFGLANFSIAHRVEPALGAITSGVLATLPPDDPASFRVLVRRADKRFAMSSEDLARAIGAEVVERRGWRVDLDRPALVIGIEIVPGAAFIHFSKESGAGGLPIGTGGRVLALLSGGIDSPVAAWRLMRRGCTATLMHFHSYPFLSNASQEKVRALAALLARYQLSIKLHLVPFGDIQRDVTLSVPSALRVVVYRRLMLRIAERAAHRAGALALVTGDIVGQVASQTLENMAVTESAISMPVFRPLVGMDKGEVTAEAVRLGTYPISIIPDEDCCTLFTPRHPVTRARLEEIDAAERGLPLQDLVERALRHSIVERFTWPVVQSAAGHGASAHAATSSPGG
jgi:thiamine biosynthesis protein ThiI